MSMFKGIDWPTYVRLRVRQIRKDEASQELMQEENLIDEEERLEEKLEAIIEDHYEDL